MHFWVLEDCASKNEVVNKNVKRKCLKVSDLLMCFRNNKALRLRREKRGLDFQSFTAASIYHARFTEKIRTL